MDLRNDIARARDTWLESVVGVECQAGMADGVYLRNRLIQAFCDGWEAAKASATPHNSAMPPCEECRWYSQGKVCSMCSRVATDLWTRHQ